MDLRLRVVLLLNRGLSRTYGAWRFLWDWVSTNITGPSGPKASGTKAFFAISVSVRCSFVNPVLPKKRWNQIRDRGAETEWEVEFQI